MNLKERWTCDENQSMKGWDFSHIKGRWYEEVLPFDYKKTVMQYLKDELLLLDMGTGGGEFLLTLNHPYDKTYATEGYQPNLDYCIENLVPLGISVERIHKNRKLPFKDDMFNIIINKHSSYSIKEIKRVLKKDGIFVTQQIGAFNNRDLSKVFIENFELPDKSKHMDIQTKEFVKQGFDILESKEYFPKIRFFDIGALVFFCNTIVWEFPDFSVDKYFNELLSLHQECEKKGFVESKEHRYFLVCKNKD